MASTTVAPEILSRLFSDSVERFELVDGELQPKPMVSIYHALLTTWLGRLLLQQVEQFADEDLWVLVDPLAKSGKIIGDGPTSPSFGQSTLSPGSTLCRATGPCCA